MQRMDAVTVDACRSQLVDRRPAGEAPPTAPREPDRGFEHRGAADRADAAETPAP